MGDGIHEKEKNVQTPKCMDPELAKRRKGVGWPAITSVCVFDFLLAISKE